MTSGLKKWLNALDTKEKEITELPPYRQYGKLVGQPDWSWKRPG